MNSSSLVYNVGKIVSATLKKGKESSSTQEPQELQLLREKCKDDNYVVSHSSCQGIVTLVEAGLLPIPKALSTLIALLPSVKVPGSVISAVGQLMVLDLKLRLQAGQDYINPFNLHSPQHPFVTILKRNQNAWDEIVNEISTICNHSDDVIRCFGPEVVKPVALYMICDPSTTSENPPVYQQPLWNILLGLKNKSLILECLQWMQMKSPANQSLVMQLAAFPEVEGLSKDDLTLTLANIAYDLSTSGKNPQPALVTLEPLLENCGIFVGSCVVIVLCHAICAAAPNHLLALLTTCHLVIEKNKCCTFAANIFTTSILPFMACPSPLIAAPLRKIQTIIAQLKLAKVVPEPPQLTSHTFPIAHLAVQSYILVEISQANVLIKWLNHLKQAPERFQQECMLILGAVLTNPKNESPVLNVCLEILVELARSKIDMVASVLTWLLSRLSQEKRPECQLALLKALPRLGKQKENVSLIINTLESLRSAPALQPLVLNLYLIMWKLEPRVFPYLHKLLLVDSIGKSDLQNYWDLTRAHTIKEICLERPNQHGKDLVGILSGILNRCTGESGATACALALEAIAALCKATVIDVASTWKVLAPRLAPDMRPVVVKNLCTVLGLMSEVPSNHPEQAKLWTDVQTRLWYYSACGLSTEVSISAFKALSKFTLEDLYLSVVPAMFKKNLPYPPEFSKSAADSSKSAEDVLNFIPGVCWPQMLAVLPTATELVTKFLSDEIETLRGALQQVPGKAEPDVPRLNIYSIFLGLLGCLRKAQVNDPVVPNILKVLAQPMPKQFPPCNWNFMETLAGQRADLLVASLKVVARQAHTSPSALKVTESLLKEAATMNLEIQDVVDIFSTLEILGKTVEPTSLRNFVEAHVRRAIEFCLADEANLGTLHKIFGHIKCTLLNDDVLEINQKLLALTLDDLMSELSWKDNKVFLPYNECVSQMHSKFLNEMTSPTTWSEVNSRKLQNAIVIRTWIAANSDENALNWVNECIEACHTKPNEHRFLFEHLIQPLVHNRKSVEVTKDWLLQLMGQIQASLLSSETNERSLYLCDVWSLAILTLSGHLVHGNVTKNRDVRLDLLPQAALSFAESPNFNGLTLQMIEWIHSVIQSKNLPEDFTVTLFKCLKALRHDDCMKKPGLWTKVQASCLRRQESHQGRHSLCLPSIRRMELRAAARLCQDHTLERGKGSGADAQRRCRGHFLADGQRVHQIHVVLPIPVDIPADPA
ncbi:focadhesin isoform X2 [Neocloeon triangulifer]|uniref:focadhesin isoform X2 n=1 Tax=Neocloeon triangulifer TaxID=2078957 RepID=UPI00286F26B5|nr:focadhesin isoform X2 [Neocloeon triangulifer]